MKVAIVHDWLATYAGSERVLEQMLQSLPNADLFSLVDFLPEDDRVFLKGKPVQTSFLQGMPFAKDNFRYYLPLMPLAVEQFDLSDYELVISSSHAVAKGVLTAPDQIHVCMCYSPMRYAWDLQHEYLRETGLSRGIKSWLTRWILHRARLWDIRTANGVDHFIAISEFIAKRIWKTYRREAEVIYPPVDVAYFQPSQHKDDFYLTASRVVPYKKLDRIVEAFNQMPERTLIVIGTGPDLLKLQAKARRNVHVLGYQSPEALRGYMQRAKAFVFAAIEDFGIAPVESMAAGTPVIAYGRGGVLETIVDGKTGLLFQEQTAPCIKSTVERFEYEGVAWDSAAISVHGRRFSVERFNEEFESALHRIVYST